jgi:ribosomal protein S27AE
MGGYAGYRDKKKLIAKNTKANRAWRRRNPEKVAAHYKVNWAIRTGRLVRQDCCRCGASRAHAHHHDYAKPLDVMWLCSQCHRREHGFDWEWIFSQPVPVRRHPVKRRRASRPPRVGTVRWFLEERRKRNKDRAQALHREGRSYSQIAKTLQISRGTAYKWVNTPPYK